MFSGYLNFFPTSCILHPFIHNCELGATVSVRKFWYNLLDLVPVSHLTIKPYISMYISNSTCNHCLAFLILEVD